MRYVALIQPADIHPATRHFKGLPAELTNEQDSPEEMPWPRVLVIRQSKGGVFLDRYTEEGESGGDTWHQSIEEAREQALAEYNGSVGPWRDVPAEMDDADLIAFALSEFGTQ
jgi:hypothetical protein